jgi:hypothetical protein
MNRGIESTFAEWRFLSLVMRDRKGAAKVADAFKPYQ